MDLSSLIIPGLTDDVAALCLSRIPRSNFRVLYQVCWRWKTFLMSEHFTAVRKLTGMVEEFMSVLVETVPGKKVYWEVFDSSGNKLGQIPNVPGPMKWGYGVTVLGGEKILFIGGYTGIPGGCVTNRNTPLASADVYEFDPATNRNISGFAFSFNSKLYAIGNGSCTVDIYDPKTKKWEELELAKSMSVYSYTVVRNKVYFLDKDMPGRLGVFDPEENSWTTVFVPTVAGGFRFGVGQWNNKCAYVLNVLWLGLVCLANALNFVNLILIYVRNPPLASADVYEFNHATNSWRKLADMNIPLFTISCFAFSFKSKLYALANASSIMNIYDPKTETWEKLSLKELLSVSSYTLVRNIVYFLDKDLTGRLGVFDPEKNS
ncbi:unnamed protein product [Brassica oleracea]|uniref:(rape) hypothetical protein n=1 Tax=Brassica napus TaxID=3708 RepID=A0A816LU75_BRANA|nr:unnamed protein product [Brassica napus]